MFDIVHARLFCLFVDVLCIFADDFSNFESVVDRLKSWANIGRASDIFEKVRPKVIIIKSEAGSSSSTTYDLLESEDWHFNLCQQKFVDFFSSITVLHLADQQISPLARHRRLKELVQCQLDEMRHVRQAYGCLYSALHLNHFFKEALKHTARTIIEPFDFVLSSRLGNSISLDYIDHLINFLQLGLQNNVSDKVMTTYIVSTILMDAYPIGMHSKFVLFSNFLFIN